MTSDDRLYCLSEAVNLLTRMIDDPEATDGARALCESARDCAINALLDLQLGSEEAA